MGLNAMSDRVPSYGERQHTFYLTDEESAEIEKRFKDVTTPRPSVKPQRIEATGHPPQGDDEDEIDTDLYEAAVNAKADEPVTQEVPPK